MKRFIVFSGLLASVAVFGWIVGGSIGDSPQVASEESPRHAIRPALERSRPALNGTGRTQVSSAKSFRAALEAFGQGDETALERVIEESAIGNPYPALKALLQWHHESSAPKGGEAYWREVNIVKKLFGAWTRHRPDRALKAALDLEDFEIRSEVIRQVGTSIGQSNDRDRLLEDICAVDDPEDRLSVMSAAMESWSKSDPSDAAMDWLSARSKTAVSTAELPALERAAVAGILEREPEVAAEWLLRRATPESLPGHYAEVVKRWASLEPNACGEWLGKLPIDPSTDEARAEFTEGIFRTDPKSAAHWADTISDPEKREQTLNMVLSHWSNIAPEAAAAFADAARSQPEPERDRP